MQPRRKLSRILVSTLGLCLVMTLAFVPSRTYAVDAEVVSDTSFTSITDLAKNALTSISSAASAASSEALVTKAYVLDPLAYAVAKSAIASIVHGVVTWANNGFNGSPAFVVNIQGQLGKVSDQTASTFFSQLTGVSLNSPFQSQVSNALQSQYYKSTSGNSFFLLNACTLTGTSASAVGTNGYDFSKGGLSGWFTFTSQPQNNPYGLYLASQSELNSRVASAQTQTQNEIAQNHGFLSWRGDCKVQGVAASTFTAGAVTGGTPLQINPDGSTSGGTLTQAAGTTVKDNGTNCLSYDVVTPGSVIESQLEKSLGSGVDTLVSANQLDEVISAVAQGLVNNVLGGSGLSGVSQPQGGGSDYFTQTAVATSTPAATANIASTLASTISTEQTALTQYQSNIQTINTAAQAAQTAATNASNSNHFACTFAEGSSASAVLQNVVEPILDNSNTALANAATSLSTLANIQASIANTSDSTAVTNATTNYQNFLAASTTPSMTDIANAQTQSQDVGNGVINTTAPAGSTTLVTELSNITLEANACTVSNTTTSST